MKVGDLKSPRFKGLKANSTKDLGKNTSSMEMNVVFRLYLCKNPYIFTLYFKCGLKQRILSFGRL